MIRRIDVTATRSDPNSRERDGQCVLRFSITDDGDVAMVMDDGLRTYVIPAPDFRKIAGALVGERNAET